MTNTSVRSRTFKVFVRFEVFTAVTMKTMAADCSHLLMLVPRSRIFLPWRLRRYVPPKHRFTQDLDGPTFKKTAFFIYSFPLHLLLYFSNSSPKHSNAWFCLPWNVVCYLARQEIPCFDEFESLLKPIIRLRHMNPAAPCFIINLIIAWSTPIKAFKSHLL
jgi:hypothetical protein